jgi:hypothetical protein
MRIALAGICLLIGCAPSLTLEGTRAQVAPESDVAACRPISSVQGSGDSKAEAEIALRNQAGQMNADRVVIGELLEADGRVKLSGKAYSCSSAQP